MTKYCVRYQLYSSGEIRTAEFDFQILLELFILQIESYRASVLDTWLEEGAA